MGTLFERYLNGTFKNASGETVPPFACVPIVDDGIVMVGNVAAHIGGKPGTTFYRQFVFNGPAEVKNGRYGDCQCGPVVIALYDTGTPAMGEGFGPKPSTWGVVKGYPEICVVRGILNSSKKLMIATLKPIDSMLAKADGTTSYESTGTFSIWHGDGVFTGDTGINISGVVNRGGDASSGDEGMIGFVNGTPIFVKECGE